MTSPLGRLLGVSGDRAANPAGNARPPKGGSSNVWYSTPGQPQVPEWDGLTALRSGYQASVYIMQPVRLIATALGSLPFRVGADPDKTADYNLNAPMAKLLGPPPGGPNPATSSRNLWIWSLVQRLVAGRMAWETVCPGADTPPVALWPLVSAFLNPIPSGPGSVRWFDGFQYQIPSGRIDYRADQIFYSWRPSQIDWRQPESALQAANMPASLQIALNQYMWALAKNGMTAKKMVITPSFAEDDERRAWEEQFAAEFTGYVNGGRTLHGYYDEPDDFGNGSGNRTPPIQVVDLATSPTDGQVLQILKAAQDDMLRTWRVPLSWLGDSSARTYENASQEAKNFWQGPVMELAAEICDDVNHMLAPRFRDGNVGWFDFSRVEALRGGSIFGQVAPDAALKAGLIEADDWRNDVGLPPLDPSDADEEILPAIEDTPGGTSKTNFSRRDTAVEFKPGRVDAADVRDLLENTYPGSVLGWVADASWKYDPAVPLDEIKMARRPGGRDFDKVQGIAQAVKDGKPMDPVVLVDTGESKLEIADGYHRTLGFDRAGRRTIAALVGSGVGVHGPWEQDMHDAKLNRTAVDVLRYDTTPLGTGKNWVTETGGLDPFLRAIAHALIRDGHTESQAIQLAVGVAKRWAAGGGKVTAKTRAKAARAVARWEAQKAAAHATPKSRDALTETSSAGALLPKGVPAAQARKIRRHMYAPGVQNRRRCAECDGPVTAPAHGLVGQRSPMSLEGLRRKTSRVVNGHADEVETQMAAVMRAMFTKQQAATLSRLEGRRGQQMLRATQPPDDGQPQQVTPTEPNVSNVFDFAHWVQATRVAVQPVYAAVQARTIEQLAADLHPGEPVFGAAVDAAKAVLDGRATALADAVTRTTYDEISAALREGLANGEGIPALAKRVRAVFDQANQNRAETIARTEVMSAINTSQDAYAKNLPTGTVSEKQWLATPDSRTRETHRMADGQRRPLGEPFTVGGFPMQHPGDHTAPPDEWINCFPSDATVSAPGVLAGSRRRFVGDMVCARTRSGARVRATPNHPVLTVNGWKPIKALAKGDHLVKALLLDDALGRPEVNDLPTTFGQVIDPICKAPGASRVIVGGVDFHGDIADCDVNVVRADRLLGRRNQSIITQVSRQFCLTRSDDPGEVTIADSAAIRPHADGIGAIALSTSRFMGAGRQERAILGSGLSHTDIHRLGSVTWNDARSEQTWANPSAGDPVATGESLFALASEISLDEVIDVDIEPFSGHVYNLQTVTGWYIANGIVAHNCRCTTLYIPASMSQPAAPAAAIAA